MLGLVSCGVGFCFAAAARVRRQQIPNVVLREVEDLNVRLNLSAVWRSDDNSPVLPKFLAVLRDVLAGTRRSGMRQLNRTP